MIAEGFVGDIALPNVRYELEYELQKSTRRTDEPLTSRTKQLLDDWQTDGEQASKEKRADELELATTEAAHRRRHQRQRASNSSLSSGRRKQASITE